MARRAPDVATEPASPPKRVTRARARNTTTNPKDETAPAKTNTSTAVKKGRPKKADTATVTATRATAASKARTTTAAQKKTTTAATRASRAKKEKEKEPVAANEDGGMSSDDEMDVVTVRSNNSSLMGSRSGSRMGSSLASSTGSMAGRARSGASATATTATTTAASRRKALAQAKTTDEVVNADDDDDEDELAQFEVSTGSARGNVAPRATRSATTATTASRTRQATTATTRKAKKAETENTSTAAGSLRSSATGAGPKRGTGPTSSSVSRHRSATAVAPKKKVTFLEITEDSDKENHVIPAAATGTSKGKAAGGMSAKPVRRAAASTTTRARKDVATTENDAAPAPAKEPLSPKKATQVAKSSSSNSEDAADSDVPSQPNTPVRQISRSPTKVASMGSTLASPAKKIDFTASIRSPIPGPSNAGEQQIESTFPQREIVPFKDFSESLMASSPAKRPPPSPFKDIMKESPKKAPIVFEPKSPSPVKGARDVMSSPLKDSPRKAKFAAAFSQWSMSCGPNGGSPAKESLLLTPARKPPMFSSTSLSIRSKRDSTIGMSGRPGTGLFDRIQEDAGTQPQEARNNVSEDTEMTLEPEIGQDNTSQYEPLQIDDSTLDILPPEHWRTEQNERIQTQDNTSPREPLPIDETTLDILPSDNWQPDQNERTPIQDEPEYDPADKVSEELENLQREVDAEDLFEISELNSTMFTPTHPYHPEPTSANTVRSFRDVPPAAPSPPVLSPVKSNRPAHFGYRDEAFESEGESMMDMSPVKHKYAQPESPAVFFGGGDYGEIGFTPLATQLNQWNATSPENRPAKKYQISGPFSPAKVQSRRPRDSLKARHSLRARNSMASRVSLAPATPSLARLFEGETTVPIHGRESLDNDGSMFDDESMCDLDVTMDTEPGTELGPAQAQAAAEPFQAEEEVYSKENALPAEPTITMPTDLFYEDPQNGNSGEDANLHDDENSIYPDEPTVTIPSTLFFEDKENTGSSHAAMSSQALPMSVTPVRGRATPRTVHTVSKVPLKGEEDGSLRISRKRARSLSAGPSGSIPQLTPTPAFKANTLPSPRKTRTPLRQFDVEEPAEPDSEEEVTPKPTRTRQSTVRSTPARSAKKPANNLVLQGAVVYTDVHTMEGADASGIFVELLTQMGARCVKSWNWNPHNSLSPVDGVEPKETRIGITHVVYKDGGVRTLEKVREANGLVKCVGVGWVLDCERADKWLDESDYAVDLSMVPRGGQKRRKSMEPRALANINGSVVKHSSNSPTSARHTMGAEEQDAAMQDLRRLSPTPQTARSRRTTVEFSVDDGSGLATPRQRREKRQSSRRARRSSIVPTSPESTPRADNHIQPPETPSFDYDTDYAFDFNYDGEEDNTISAPSPTTPFYLSQRSKLVQQTCPPKESRQGLFDIKPRGRSGAAGGEEFTMSEGLRKRLEAARRKSLVWKPKVGSPLAK